MRREKIVFLWANYGPMHVDRCEAVSKYFGDERTVVGLELTAKSRSYDWVPESSSSFEKRTLITGDNVNPSAAQSFFRLWRETLKLGRGKFFFAHYERLDVLLCAWWLRLTGSKVFIMSCSKFDDKPRNSIKEALKRFYLFPYHGAISSGSRPADYMRFLGIKSDMVVCEYNTVSVERIRQMSETVAAPAGLSHRERRFLVVARLVPKKNLFMLLDAYAIYRRSVINPRGLDICGSGPLEEQLIAKIASLDLTREVQLHGFLQTKAVSRMFGQSLALILPSVEEQFGNVVIEAQALGLPILLSDNCGARDRLVRTGVNGFVFEPDNERGLAYFMKLLSDDERLWKSMCLEALSASKLGDVGRFADAVASLDALTS